MKKIAGVLAAICLLASAIDADAIPLFARKYKVSCFSCHVSEPLLNEFGERFRSNGFEIPGAGSDKTLIQDKDDLPLAFVMQPKVAHTQTKDNLTSRITTENVFKPLELGLFSTASLGSHFSYLTEIEVELEKEGTSVGLGMTYLLYTDVLNNASGNLNFRLGKMHVGLPLTHTSFLANTDPLIYGDHPFPSSVMTKNDLHFAHMSFGLAAFGMFPDIAEGLHWEVAFTGGSKNEIDFRNAYAGFGSLNQAFELGHLPMKVGAFFFGGAQRIITDAYLTYPKTDNHYRTGFDLELRDPWVNRLHLFGQYVIGNDDNTNYFGMQRKVSGGFAGLHAILFPEKLYAFARYDFLTSKDTTEKDGTQFDAGLRYHLLSNVVLTAGFTQKNSRFGTMGSMSSHNHSIRPAEPLDEDDEEPVTPGASTETGPTALDLTTTSFYLGILFGY